MCDVCCCSHCCWCSKIAEAGTLPTDTLQTPNSGIRQALVLGLELAVWRVSVGSVPAIAILELLDTMPGSAVTSAPLDWGLDAPVLHVALPGSLPAAAKSGAWAASDC